jgi:hypothetical protein
MATNPYSLTGFQNPTTKKGIASNTGSFLNSTGVQQYNTQNQRGSEYGSLFPQYQDMLNSGYSPTEQSNIEQRTQGAIKGAFSGARSDAANRLARTRNSAGYGSFLGDLSQQEGQQSAGATQSNQIAFANEKQRRREAGMQGIAGLYGLDTSFLDSLGNQQLGAMGIGNSVQSRSKGVLGTISGIEGLFPGLRAPQSGGGGGGGAPLNV